MANHWGAGPLPSRQDKIHLHDADEPIMTTHELTQIAHPFLDNLSENHLNVLATLGMAVHFPAGATIFKQGDVADRFYLIHKGRVSLRSTEPDGRITEIQQLHSGGVLGWSWLFEPYNWHYDAVATEETEATFFYGTWLRDRCEQDPALGCEIMHRIARVVIARLQAARESYRKLVLMQTRPQLV
jgi:CRP-like cAMP-binding protein